MQFEGPRTRLSFLEDAKWCFKQMLELRSGPAASSRSLQGLPLLLAPTVGNVLVTWTSGQFTLLQGLLPALPCVGNVLVTYHVRSSSVCCVVSDKDSG